MTFSFTLTHPKTASMRVVTFAIVLRLVASPTARAVGPLETLPRAATTTRGYHPLGPIVFARIGDGDANLWAVRADGTNLRRLTSSRKDDTEPAWAPRGPRIVFARSGVGGSDLYTLDIKHGRPELLIENGRAPAWSPADDRIAFVRTVAGNTDIYTAAVDGTDMVQVTSDPAVDTDPTWGPGGARLTFASDRDGDFDIYSADPDGSNVRILTDDAVDQRDPFDLWTWRDIGYDQGPEDASTWCWQDIGVPEVVPGTATSCADPGKHSYSIGTGIPFAHLVLGSNGVSHLWAEAWGQPAQLTFGRKSDADPAVRPANKGVVTALTRAAGDIDQGLRGAQAWVDANGSGTGADEGPAGLITEAPTLCLVDADELSSASAATCDAGSGTGSTSVYADADEISLARDTGLGFCLWATFHSRFAQPWEARFDMTFNAPGCTGRDARQAIHSSW